jgi:hypothetical protein
MLCSICFNEIKPVGSWTEGNNAEPVNMGRCCNDCDAAVVFPARMAMMMSTDARAQYRDMLREQYEVLRRMFDPTAVQQPTIVNAECE